MKTTIITLSLFLTVNCIAQVNQWERCNNNGACNYLIRSFIETPGSLIASGTCVSSDSGSTWLLAGSNFAFSLKTTSSGIFAGGISEIYFSGNSGTTWSTIYTSLGANNFIYDLTVSGDTVYAASRGSGVLMTPDNGNSWVTLNNGLPSDSTLSILTKGNVLLIGMYGFGIYRSTDAGNSWVSANNGIPGNAYVNSIVTDNQNIYATNGIAVYISTDDGITWSQLMGSPAVNKLLVAGSTILAGGYAPNGTGGVFRSLDQGATWNVFNNGLPVGCNYGISALYTGTTYVYLGMESQCGSIYRLGLIDIETGVGDEINALQPRMVHPNPFSDEIAISNNDGQLKSIIIFDASGRKVVNETFQSNMLINTQKLEQGFYTYQIVSKSNIVQNGKLVKAQTGN